TFNATFAATNLTSDNPDAQLDVAWDLANPVIHVELHETLATSDANHLTVTINFSVVHGSETVAVTGTITVVSFPASLTANLSITVNGVAYARVRGSETATTNTIQLVKAEGAALSAPAQQPSPALFVRPGGIGTAINNWFSPW